MRHILLLLLVGGIVSIYSCSKDNEKDQKLSVTYDNGPTDSLKINQVQVVASHNSYHIKTDSAILAFMLNLNSLGALPASYNPNELDYTNVSLEEQLQDYDMRGLEIDIFNDPQGGQYANREAYSFLSMPTASHIAELNQPGFKVLHIPDFDFNTTNYTFKSALNSIRSWSLAHPNHLPLFINVETNEETVADALPTFTQLTHSIPYDATAADNMDVEIKEVFGQDLNGVITPDQIRGNYSTLKQAVLAGNWPQLAQARGKVIFIMQGAAENEYKQGHPSLQGRAMFVYSNPNTDEAAFVILNSPVADRTEIEQRVAQGFIVRTRADEATTQARTGDYTNMNAAFDGGAQIVSTDYYKPDARAGTPGWTNYHVQLPNGAKIARINPISAADKATLGTIKE